MDGEAMLVDCPAFLGQDGAVRCGLPAEAEAWYTIRSTDGPLESVKIRCPRGHWFNGPDRSPERDGIAADPARSVSQWPGAQQDRSAL